MIDEHPFSDTGGVDEATIGRAAGLRASAIALFSVLAVAACCPVRRVSCPPPPPVPAPRAYVSSRSLAEVTAQGVRVADLWPDTVAEENIRDLLRRLDVLVTKEERGVSACRISSATVRWRLADKGYLRICATTDLGEWEGFAEQALDLICAWVKSRSNQVFPAGFSRLQVDDVAWSRLFSAAEDEMRARGYAPRQEVFIQDGNVLSAGGKPGGTPEWAVRLLEADPQHSIMSVTHMGDPWDSDGEEKMAVAILRRAIGPGFDGESIHRFRYP